MKKVLFLVMILMTFVFLPKANAAIFWDWELLNNNAVFSTTEDVVIKGRLFNLESSNMNMVQEHFYGRGINYVDPRGPGRIDFENNYTSADFLPGVDPFAFDPFEGLDIAPGESFDFEFWRFVPTGTDIPSRDYGLLTTLFSPHDIHEPTSSIDFNPEDIEKEFNFSVEDFETAAVPEPATMLLLGGGLLGSVWRKRKKV